MAIRITPEEKNILQQVSIPPRPEALLKVSEEAKKAEPDIAVIAKAISSDISISAAVLQVVNSAAFRRATQIQSIEQAVMVLGFKRVFPLVKSVALKSAMSANAYLNDFWQEQSQIALACTLVAQAINQNKLADHAYMLGLFHSAGVGIMVQQYPEYLDILAIAEQQGWADIGEIEEHKFHTRHTTIGALLGQQWQLPKTLIEVIYYFHDVDGIYSSGELDATGLHLLSILKIARYCVNYALRQEQQQTEWFKVQDQLENYLHLSESNIDDMRDKIIEQLTW